MVPKTGSIVGTVNDPADAVGGGAQTTITNLATGQVINLATNSSGAYNSGALVPGKYRGQSLLVAGLRPKRQLVLGCW